jgi:tellurite resistance protein TerC
VDLFFGYMTGDWLGMPAWAWLSFLLVVLTMLAVDSGIFHRKAHTPSVAENVVIAGTAMTLGLSFSAVA